MRPRELQDNALPSGNAMAVKVLLKLGRFGAVDQKVNYTAIAEHSLASMAEMMGKYPLAFGAVDAGP